MITCHLSICKTLIIYMYICTHSINNWTTHILTPPVWFWFLKIILLVRLQLEYRPTFPYLAVWAISVQSCWEWMDDWRVRITAYFTKLIWFHITFFSNVIVTSPCSFVMDPWSRYLLPTPNIIMIIKMFHMNTYKLSTSKVFTINE